MSARTACLFAACIAIVAVWACGGDEPGLATGDGTPGEDAGAVRSDANAAGVRASDRDGASETDAGPLGCDSPDVIVCDGFDAPAIDAAR